MDTPTYLQTNTLPMNNCRQYFLLSTYNKRLRMNAYRLNSFIYDSHIFIIDLVCHELPFPSLNLPLFVTSCLLDTEILGIALDIYYTY